MALDVAVATTGDGTARKLLRAVEEFHTYLERHQTFIPNYGERCRYGEHISTGFVESTVNQVISKRFCKKQQMRWTKRGAYLLLQTRVKTLNREFGAVFQRWYSGSAAGGRTPGGVTPSFLMLSLVSASLTPFNRETCP
jgi:hypothetical protein